MTRSDGTLNASWPAVSGATHYHVTYTVNGSGSWHLGALNHPSASIAISGVDNSKSYVVATRAGNDGGWSSWRNSPAAGPYVPPAPARPTGLSATPGDGSVTLAWNDPANSTITGYEYRVRWAGVAWGEWTAISGNVTTATVTGLTNGTEYRFKLRAVNVSGTSRPAPAASPWYVAATPKPLTAPTGLTVTPGVGYLDIAWDAVIGATGYDVRAKASGSSSWHSVASDVSGTSLRYATSQTIDYVGVRARSANSFGPWAELSRMPSDDLLNVATGLSSGGASIQSVQAQSQLVAPTWGTITRKWVTVSGSRLELATELDLNWTGDSGATGYNLTCSDVGGWEWYICGWVDATNSNTVTYTSVPSAQSQPVTVSHYRRTSENQQPAGDYRLTYERPLMVSIRAVNANPADASAWTTTPTIRNVLPNLRDFTVTRTDDQISMSWTPNKWTTGYEVYCDTYTEGETASYTLCATLTNQDDTAASHSVTITKSGGAHNWSALDDTSTLDIAIDSANAYNKERFLAPFIYPNYKLTVSNVGLTTATLTIAKHSGAWYYKANAAPDNTCQGPVNAGTKTKNLTGLSEGTAYTYSAYSDSECTTTNLLATAAQFTTISYVTNLTSTKASYGNHIANNTKQAVAFTTGSNDGGYTLKNVIVPLRRMTSREGTFEMKLYPMVGSTYSTTSAPSATAVSNATLAGTAPTAFGTWTDTTFTCSGSGCNLSKDTTYFVVLTFSAPTDLDRYEIAYTVTADLTETTKPTNSGWDIGYGHYDDGSWASYGDFSLARFEFTNSPSLSSSNVTATGATLTLTDHNGAWWLKQTAPTPEGNCTAGESDYSHALDGLTGSTAYTFKAYSDSTCSTLLATADFTTLSYDHVTNLTSTKQDTERRITRDVSSAVAFTTGPNANGYTLKNITATLKSSNASVGVGDKGLELKLHTMVGSTYSTTSAPSATAVANATLTGTAPTGSTWTDTKYTCSGAGCSLSKDTTYFIVATFDGTEGYVWAYTTTANLTETTVPTNSGWDIEYAHYKEDRPTPRPWTSYSDYNLARVEFTTTE